MESTTQQDKDPKREAIAHHLESIVRNCTTSINNRTFDSTPSLPSWDSVSPSFEVTHDTGSRPSTHTKADLLAGFKTVTAAFPDYRLEIFSCTTEVDWGNGVGTVFVNAQESGGPGVPGGVLARKHVAVFEFRRDGEGRWMGVREATIFGLGVEWGVGDGGLRLCGEW